MRWHVAEQVDPRRRLPRRGLEPGPRAMAREVDVAVDVAIGLLGMGIRPVPARASAAYRLVAECLFRPCDVGGQ